MRGSLGDLAAMPGMPSEVTLRKIIADNPHAPWIVSRGRNGIAYEIDLSGAFGFVRGLEEEKRAVAASRMAEVRQLGLELLGDDAAAAMATGPALSSDDRRKLLEEELVAIKVAEKRRELVRRDQVTASVNEFVMAVAARQSTLADRLGKVTNLSRDGRAALERLIDRDRNEVAAMMERMEFAASSDQDGDPAL